jgi:putative solute:sodium symporter small subunit
MFDVVRSEHWPRLKNLLIVLFAAWLAFFLVTHAFIKTLNKIVVPVLQMPLGVYMPMQAAIIVFVVAVLALSRLNRTA